MKLIRLMTFSGRAGEPLAQVGALGADADRAGVGVALADQDAAHGDQRQGADAVLLGPQQGGDDDVAAGLEAAVGAQGDAVAQAVQGQDLVDLGQAHLPGRAGVLDRGLRAGAGAADMAGDQDHVGLGLGDAGGDGADAALGDQLHADPGVGVDLLQVVDELRQVLDRVDVVVRRRRDQGDAGGGVAQAGDLERDLEAGQLAALAGLGPLRHLDLELLGGVQVFGGDAEPAGGHLLDRRVGVVAVGPRAGSAPDPSPPSPLSELAPMRFMAMVSVSCASGESAPSDMPGVTKRFLISVMLSTSSSGTGGSLRLKSSRSRIEIGSCACSMSA